MTGKADFTEEEWELVREGPPAAGMVALTAEKGGTFRESWALAKSYTEARKEHGESELLDSLVASKPETKRYSSPRRSRPRGSDGLTEAVALLEQKATPDEVKSYKKFVLAVAERVAEAHREGDQNVSEGERAAIEKIASSLYPSGSE